MSLPQQGSTMQAATQRCPPGVFRERYSLADFEITRVYGEGPNWAICAARCKWSAELVVLQIYTQVGNVSGCMALALGAAHSLTHHPALLPLYAVFRDVVAGGTGGGTALGAGAGDWPGPGPGAGPGARADRVVMVYPGGPAQHPLDAGAPSASASASASALGGPPVSERGVVRGLLQPLNDLLTALGSPGLRPTFVCGLDVWMDSPEAPAPGQALFMVPLMCHRRPRESLFDLPPAALPYAAPFVRSNPAAAVEQVDCDELLCRRWLSWSAAALVHTALIGTPPPDKPQRRRKPRSSDPLTSPISPTAAAAAVPQLPPLSSGSGGSSPRKHNALAALGMQRPGAGGAGVGSSGMPVGMLQPSHSTLSSSGSAGGPHSNGHSRAASSVNGATTSTAGPVSSPSMMFGGSAARGGHGHGSRGTGHGGPVGRSPHGPAHGVLEPVPLWLSDEAGDWFRRGLALECSQRAALDELMRHAWVCRHALPRSLSASGHVVKRESLNGLPRELHPLLLDVVPLGVSRPGREECDSMMAEMARTVLPRLWPMRQASEAPSAAKPAMPWQLVEGPQKEGHPAAAAASAPAAAAAPPFDPLERAETPQVAVRYEVAEEERDDGTRLMEELRVVSSDKEHMTRAAKALQAAMAKRGDVGQWIMANPRGTTFDDIAKQNQLQRSQGSYTMPPAIVRQRRGSISGPGLPLSLPSPGPPSPGAQPPPSPLQWHESQLGSVSPPPMTPNRPASRLVGTAAAAPSGAATATATTITMGSYTPAPPFPGGGGGARGRSPARGAARGLSTLPASRAGARPGK